MLRAYTGMALGLPSIGCAKSVLIDRYESLGDERDATAPMIDPGEIVAIVVRMRTSA